MPGVVCTFLGLHRWQEAVRVTRVCVEHVGTMSAFHHAGAGSVHGVHQESLYLNYPTGQATDNQQHFDLSRSF